jgi:Icc-related predicted phosphoesterase
MKFSGPLFLFLFLLSLKIHGQEINVAWEPREDLNILLPNSIKVYDTHGKLADGNPVRAMYAVIDLRDENLKLRAHGSNTRRQTTLEAYEQLNGILAINGGYFSDTTSVSVLVSDGEVVSAGPAGEVIRGAFGMRRGEPEIVWTNAGNSVVPYKFNTPKITGNRELWNPAQAVGGGPVLVKNGEMHVTTREEGFGGSHLQRHPRSAIGYKDKNTLLLMIVDGRQLTSAGVTLHELAEMMLGIGAKEALNLDGGGSSAMVAAGEVVNVPVDVSGGNRNSLRRNASALIFSEIEKSEKRKIYLFDTGEISYSETGVWKNSNQPNFYGNTPSRVALANRLNKAEFQFDGIQQNKYQLATWFTVNPDENTPEAVYVVHHNASTDTIVLDQSRLSHTGKWLVLGNYLLNQNDKIEILSRGDEGKLITDAIRLVTVRDSPELPLRGDVRIAVISDLNSGLGAADYEWQVDSIIQRIPRLWQPDLVISGGDMVAGMGINDTVHLQKMWDGFDKHIAQPLRHSNIPFAFTLGNHDGPRSHPVERNFTRKYWNKPENKSGLNFVDATHFPNYYSFLKDEIFIVSWEASSSEITAENLGWMKDQFNTAEAKNAKLRVVMGHMPLYSSAQERDSKGNVLDNPEKLRKLLEENNVHTYVSGHQHAYYPARRGALELLNTGAAGSGERSWLTMDKKPVNTVTIMDIFYEKDTIVYSTYVIKEKNAADMQMFDQKELPSAMFGVNGHMLRRDIPVSGSAAGNLYAINVPGDSDETGTGIVLAKIKNDQLVVTGEIHNLYGQLLKNNPVGLYLGRNMEPGELVSHLNVRTRRNSQTFEGKVNLTEDLKDFLSIGAMFVQINTEQNPTGALRAQLYPETNQSPSEPQIVSHSSRNVYGVRDIEALYEVQWDAARDEDGDFVSYNYQLAGDKDFDQMVFQKKTGRNTILKMTEKDWFSLLGSAKEGEIVKFYHRVIATDGSNMSHSTPALLQLMKTNEPLDDLIEVPAPEYVFAGKIDADGAGYGTEWDKEGKLWLADYNGGLIIKNKDGIDADFSPLSTVVVNGETYNLRPVNGIGVDNDGNILVGRNRHLIKIDSKTGKGMAVWEVPESNRAITSPRASTSGEIYIMSLFAEDGGFILKQSLKDPSTFELIRKIELPGRNLSRTFDITADGKNLYFPDPGSPLIQHFSSVDGINYKKDKDISSVSAGSSAIQILGNSIYVATRSSGISPSTFHYRNEKEQKMWTLELPEVNGAEPRGIGVSPDGKTLIFCSWDKGGGYYRYELKE